jgi:hypothetical protein
MTLTIESKVETTTIKQAKQLVDNPGLFDAVISHQERFNSIKSRWSRFVSKEEKEAEQRKYENSITDLGLDPVYIADSINLAYESMESNYQNVFDVVEKE